MRTPLMARRPGAAQAQDSDTELVKPTLALLAAIRREHREPTESGIGKPPVRGASRVVDALWSAESAAPIVQCYFLGIHLNAIPARRQIAQGERGVCRGAPAARAALGVYYLGQRVASIAGAEEQEPVRHGVPGSALLGLCDAQGQRTGSSCLRHSSLPLVPLIRNASTGLHATCRTSLIRSSRARRKARVLPMDPPACALVTDPSSMELPQATVLLHYTLRPTSSGTLCPHPLGTHIVFRKANVRMFFRFDALRIRIYHTPFPLPQNFGSYCGAPADFVMASKQEATILGLYVGRLAFGRCVARALGTISPHVALACVSKDNCAYATEYDSFLVSLWSATSRAVHSGSEDVRTALQPPWDTLTS